MPATDPSIPAAVLFDFGGVITTSPFDAFATYEARNNLPSGLIRTINSTNPDDNAWAKLERGSVDLAEFGALFEAEAKALGHAVDAAAILSLLSGELRPQMVEALHRLAGTFRLALLTNNFVTSAGDGTRPSAAGDVLSLFEVIVESSTAGCRKPEPRFYEIALEQLGIDAHEAVFLDDLGINLKPARSMGMQTIKVIDPDDALRELSNITRIDLLDEPARKS